jgi:hypothetical protein
MYSCGYIFLTSSLISSYTSTLLCQENYAKVAELVDALDLGSSGVTRESSSLSFRTISIIGPVQVKNLHFL